MKTWTMPKVYLEKFHANDYVAACQGTKPIPVNGVYYADIYDDNGNGGYGGYTGPDNTYNGSGFEKFSNGSLPSNFTNAFYNPSGQWFYGVQFYTAKTTPNIDELYSNTRVFTPYDTFDVYVSSKGLVLYGYPAGTGGQYDPETKPYS